MTFAGLLNELSLQSTTEQTRQERSRFVQELVISSAAEKSEKGEEIPPPPPLKALLKLIDSSPKDFLKEETELEDTIANQTGRQGNVVLRGRARSDAQNAKRRAEANRVSLETKQKSGEDMTNVSKR